MGKEFGCERGKDENWNKEYTIGTRNTRIERGKDENWNTEYTIGTRNTRIERINTDFTFKGLVMVITKQMLTVAK